MKCRLLLSALVMLFASPLRAESPSPAAHDPFTPFLDGKPPEILREVASTNTLPADVSLKSLVFRSRDNSEIFAVIASPKTPGKHPGMLVLHGGGQSAAVEQAIAWAQRGYVAVAPDLPGIADPKKVTLSKGPWSSFKYGEGRWKATPDGGASILFDAVLAAMKSLELLRLQPDVDPSRIGVVGISWGGYMTTMVCALAGEKVRAGFSVFGCGFYEYTAQENGPKSPLGALSPEERERWLAQLDPGRRAPAMKSAFFIAGASNDFFFWPRAVQATLNAISGEKNHLFAPNANHKALVPGGSPSGSKPASPASPFVPTAFQPYPTSGEGKDLWLTMEEPYFDYYLKGLGKPLPQVTVRPTRDNSLACFDVSAPHPLTKVEIYWAKALPPEAATDPAVMTKAIKERQWIPLPATKGAGNTFEAKLPPEAVVWFAQVSDDRPVTVSGDLVELSLSAEATKTH